jgi:hypothetical protein
VFLQVALAALSSAVIALTSKALTGLVDDRHKIQRVLPRANLEAKPLVGVGIALVVVGSGVIFFAVRLPHASVTNTRKISTEVVSEPTLS